jgi:threonine dehydrogenase-like Zn-dependent dehydrogenase
MADVVADVAGGPMTLATAVAVARKRATVLVAAGRSADPELVAAAIARHLAIKGVRGHRSDAVALAIRLIESGAYPLHELSTCQVGLHEVERALTAVGGEGRAEAIHAAVLPWQ